MPDSRIAAALLGALVIMAGCATAPRAPLAQAAFPGADSVRSAQLATGVTHTFLQLREGPWAVHVVEVDARACVPFIEARKPGPDLAARATTTDLGRDAVAAINADFFMPPGGTPVGAHVTGAVPLIGPTDRQVFAVTVRGWSIGVATLNGSVAARADSAALVQVNRRAAPFSAYGGTTAGVTLFTSWIGDSVPADSAARRVVLRVLDGDGARGRGVVTAADSAVAVTPVTRDEVVLLAHGPARAWAARRLAGDTVSWSAAVHVAGAREPAIEALGGFPELLRDGRPVLAEQTVREEFGARRHPRTAIGWTPDRRLLLVSVDGRQPPYSDGMSLDELTWLFQQLGASDALNLDGGGSTAMVVRGTLVNRPSDRDGERPVGNALALVRCHADQAPLVH